MTAPEIDLPLLLPRDIAEELGVSLQEAREIADACQSGRRGHQGAPLIPRRTLETYLASHPLPSKRRSRRP